MERGGEVAVSIAATNPDTAFYGRHPQLTPGVYVLLEVTDHGVGMDQETLRRAFDPFFSTKLDTDRKGNGLGLAVVYGIVRNHKGVVEIQSEPGRGTTVQVYLPLGKLPPAEDAPGAPGTIQAGRGTVLIADDEATFREPLRQMLEVMGYHCILAENGAEAIGLYLRNKSSIDCVLLDLKMPVVSGSDAFQKIREINPEARIVIATGFGLNEEAQQLLDEGAVAVCAKPFSMQELSDAVALATR